MINIVLTKLTISINQRNILTYKPRSSFIFFLKEFKYIKILNKNSLINSSLNPHSSKFFSILLNNLLISICLELNVF